MISNKKAFTMIELIFVIVIMAIIGKFGVEFLAGAYRTFIFSKINHELQSNSAYAVEFISKRLEHRIKNSVVTRNTSGGNPGAWTYLSSSNDDNATVLEWIGADIDGFRGLTNVPTWSGVIDVEDGNATALVSPGTDVADVNTIIDILSSTNSGINDSVLYFIASNYTTNSFGYDGAIATQAETLHPIQNGGAADEFLPNTGLIDFTGRDIFEYYKLAWSAYAVVHTPGGTGGADDTLGTLTLYYDYQPWQGENWSDNGVKSAVLMENVSSWRFRAAGSLIKIQVCAKSDLTGERYSLCKEKTIY